MPEPPSVVALPPTPMTTWRTPASRTARRISPVPSVVAASGARGSSAGRRESPDASASSTAARFPSADRSQLGHERPAQGVVGGALLPLPAAALGDRGQRPLAAVGEGSEDHSSAGRAAAQPSARARATSTEVNEPLKESGAIRTRRRRESAHSMAGLYADARLRNQLHQLRGSGARHGCAGVCSGRAGASRGTRGSGSSAAARGRPVRGPPARACRRRIAAASSSIRARRRGAPCAAPRVASSPPAG